MQIFKQLFLLNDVNDFTLINNFLLNALETILYDFTHTLSLIDNTKVQRKTEIYKYSPLISVNNNVNLYLNQKP